MKGTVIVLGLLVTAAAVTNCTTPGSKLTLAPEDRTELRSLMAAEQEAEIRRATRTLEFARSNRWVSDGRGDYVQCRPSYCP